MATSKTSRDLQAWLTSTARQLISALAFFAILIGPVAALATPPRPKSDLVDNGFIGVPLNLDQSDPAVSVTTRDVSNSIGVDPGSDDASPVRIETIQVAASNPVAPAANASATSAGLQFIPVGPCRVSDTRNPVGTFGGPSLTAGATREFDIPQSGCGIPSTAVAYSLNVTAVPAASLNYLTIWPSGQTQPYVSTLNSPDGRIKANAAITPAGTNGGVNVFVSDAANVILDIDGYFVPAATASSLAFYPVTPCRVVDTRTALGTLGGPSIAASSSRSFPIQSSNCGIPSTAKAYSLNVTAIPHTTLNYLTAWATGQAQPYVSTLNSPTGAVTANAAVVPAGSGGAVSIFMSDDADVILDVNGYFAAPSSTGLSLYTVSPCRVLDTRASTGAFSGVLDIAIASSICAPPAAAHAFVLNATVVPPGPLNYLTLWPDGQAQPYVSTLNADDGAIASNMAIVPSANGNVDVFSSDPTQVILDISSYFAPPAATAGGYTLTVNSSSPTSGVAIAASPADSNAVSGGTTSFTLVYKSGTSVSLSAPSAIGNSNFVSWTGCNSVYATTCFLQMTANTIVSVAYGAPTSVTGVTISPTSANLATGATQQFTATVAGTGSFTPGVTWSVNGVAGGNTTIGTIDSNGFYVTPFPAPGSIIVTATSVFDSTKSATATVNLTVPTLAGPALAVDAAAGLHTISPFIYGMNAYDPTGNFQTLATAVRLPLDRWGGDQTTRYNYLADVYNSASDYFYESYQSANSPLPANGVFNLQVVRDVATHTTTLGTMPLIGWTTKAPATNPVCGFSVAKYGAQQKTDPYNPDCGNGQRPDGSTLTGNDPLDTSFTIDQTWTTQWMQYLVPKFGNAASGGIAIYDLDNEPEYWVFVHHDVHPAPLTYDELTTKGITYAKAIKAVDPTAAVSGPVISAWTGYFYSPKDWISGWSTGPNYVYNDNPVDRLAHGDIPLIEYYLQQFKAAEVSGGTRLLDYLDIHAYFAAQNAAFASAGATDLQTARVNSTRAFWDPTYTDPNYTDPNNRTNTAQPVPPMLIPRMRTWVATDYPGTKLAIDEYNWGAQDHINGAVAQADILGIFGREGLDLGALWGAPDPATQQPSVNAFAVFRNYDGNGASFGDTSVSATSSNQYMLSIYAATRASDNTLTVVVVNKSFSNLTSTVTLGNVAPIGPAQVFLYSNANLANIVAQPSIAVTSNAITTNFPAQSITILAIPE